MCNWKHAKSNLWISHKNRIQSTKPFVDLFLPISARNKQQKTTFYLHCSKIIKIYRKIKLKFWKKNKVLSVSFLVLINSTILWHHGNKEETSKYINISQPQEVKDGWTSTPVCGVGNFGSWNPPILKFLSGCLTFTWAYPMKRNPLHFSIIDAMNELFY